MVLYHGLKNPEGQVARWIEFLGTYDFKIQHRAGLKHMNADGLSKRPCDDCSYCERQEQKETNATFSETSVVSVSAIHAERQRCTISVEHNVGKDGTDPSKTSHVDHTGPQQSWLEVWSTKDIQKL